MQKTFNYQLSNREIIVLRELVSGKNNIEIGNSIGLSPHTVKFYISSILTKLSVNSRIQAAIKAVREEIVS